MYIAHTVPGRYTKTFDFGRRSPPQTTYSNTKKEDRPRLQLQSQRGNWRVRNIWKQKNPRNPGENVHLYEVRTWEVKYVTRQNEDKQNKKTKHKSKKMSNTDPAKNRVQMQAGARERYAVPASYKTLAVLLVYIVNCRSKVLAVIENKST